MLWTPPRLFNVVMWLATNSKATMKIQGTVYKVQSMIGIIEDQG